VGIIKESLTTLYLLSDKKAHINYFFAENFMNHGQQTYGNIANDEWNIYQRIRESENGRILNDTILLGGLNTVGFPQQTQPIYSQYYNEKLLAKKYPWKESDIIEFPWNQNGKDFLILQIETFQQLGERVLDFNSILKILDLAYDVVGGKGDRWASKPAKELLLVALSDLDATLQKLVDCFIAFIDLQNRSRHKYNHKNSINPQEDWNANFTLISQAIEEIDKYKNSVKSSIEAVGNVIRKFPISSDILDTKEKQFSQEVRKRQGIEFPDIAEDLIPEESSSAASSSADMGSSLGKVETWINEINNLRFPITSTLNGFLIIDKPGLKIFKDDEKKFKVLFSKGWGISNYNNWANGFVTYHQKFFNDFHETLDQLKLSISSKDINNIQTQQTHLNAIFTQISNELDKERPMWKFKYGIFPIRLGRPFNRRAASFANLFKTELETTYVSMNSLIGKLILALKSETADNSQKESEESDYLTLMKTIQSLSLSTSQSIKNTTQLIAQWNEKKARKTEVQHALSTTLAELEECTPSVEESKVSSSNSSNTSSSLGISTSVAPTDMMVWIEGMYSQYLKWQGQGYQGDIQFFIDTASALKTLDVMVENRNSIDPDVREILLDPIFTLYKELNFCIKKFSTKSSDNQYNLDQLQIFSNLLKIVLDIQPDDNNKSREQFEKLCSGILAKQKAEASIAIPYSSHGLLRPNASVSSNTHRPEYVSPSIVR
jgi:hypothetical protein